MLLTGASGLVALSGVHNTLEIKHLEHIVVANTVFQMCFFISEPMAFTAGVVL